MPVLVDTVKHRMRMQLGFHNCHMDGLLDGLPVHTRTEAVSDPKAGLFDQFNKPGALQGLDAILLNQVGEQLLHLA